MTERRHGFFIISMVVSIMQFRIVDVRDKERKEISEADDYIT